MPDGYRGNDGLGIGPERELRPVTDGHATGDGAGDGADLKVLLGRLNRDATQFVHDELELAKLELRDVAEAFADDVQSAGMMLARDMAMIGVALSLATLAGLALTAGAILAVGQLLGGAFWAGGMIVGAVLLVAAGILGWSAVKDMGDSDSLRLQHGRRTLHRDKNIMQEEARRTKAAAREGASDFKREVKRDVPSGTGTAGETTRH